LVQYIKFGAAVTLVQHILFGTAAMFVQIIMFRLVQQSYTTAIAGGKNSLLLNSHIGSPDALGLTVHSV
jgi:hypothetical protein